MLNSFRKFTKSFWAKILLVFIIIPFVFWGMGSAFKGGNKNTLAKINNHNVSTKEFMEYFNSLNIDPEAVRKNINNSVIEQMLSDLINKTILSLENEDLNIKLSDRALYEIIKKNKLFLDDKKQFSRIKYEKFLLSNNLSAALYERNLRKEQSNKFLFNYISGGIVPPTFSVKNTYNKQNNKLITKTINLNSLYKKINEFDELNIKKFIDENIDQLREDYISIRFAKLNPLSLIDSSDFNELFFEKIDEIENLIINDTKFNEIVKKYNLETYIVNSINKNSIDKNGTPQNLLEKNLVENLFKIKLKEKNKVYLLETKEEYSLLTIDEIENSIPNIKSRNFREKILKSLLKNDIARKNMKLINEIKSHTLSESKFNELAKTNKLNVNDIVVNGIRDDGFFSLNSNSKIFKLQEKGFTIVNEIKKNKFFLVWVKDIENLKFNKSTTDYNKYYFETIINLKNNIYASYDSYINQKYKVEVNYQTLERLKNYFR